MRSEERRKIIEEVAGISVYEWRKEKALKELDKTDARLKEVTIILRQRTAYLNNLEKEKSAAEKYKETQLTIKRAKASITKRKLEDKGKEVESLNKAITEKTVHLDKKRESITKTQIDIDDLTDEVTKINKHVRDQAGMEQGRLREEITILRADLEGLRVRREGQEYRLSEIEHRMSEMKSQIPDSEAEIKNLQREAPQVAQKVKELKKKKEELAEIEKERKQVFSLKSELNSVKDRLMDKAGQLARTTGESESLVSQIENLSGDLNYASEKECTSAAEKIRASIAKLKSEIEEHSSKEIDNTKIISVAESEIERNEEIKSKVDKLDDCPLCQSKITKEHISHVNADCDKKIKEAKEKLNQAKESIGEATKNRTQAREKVQSQESKLQSVDQEKNLHTGIEEKKEILKRSVDHETTLKTELVELAKKQKFLDGKTMDGAQLDERHHAKILEIEEISSRTQEDVDTTLLYKERELEKTKSIVERSAIDLKEITDNVKTLETTIKEKETSLTEKEKKETALNEKFNTLFNERDAKQRKIQELNIDLHEGQSEVRQMEDQVNYLRIGKAKLDGERETMEMDMEEYVGVELLHGSLNALEERLRKALQTVETIGSINMRALEVYQDVKEEYDLIKQKVDILDTEKTEILKIIEEVDKKKKKTFMRTYKAINELFTQNYIKLTTKGGTAYLEIENKEDLFEGGIDIVVKLSKGKYFDVNSLSGGEQTMVALSLLFAIQEFKPYHFWSILFKLFY